MAVDPLAAALPTASLALARRFSAGATLWCLAPTWPAHAEHLAVEFVHPVVVGKRALPAVVVPGADPVAVLRVTVRPGDVVCAVAPADHEGVGAVMRRAAPWGLTTVWIGAGPRPPAGAADHVLWLDGPEDEASHGGGFVLAYHLLWELTHVCFEHPGLLSEEQPDAPACITCSDEGRVGEVVAPGRVRTAGRVEDVDLSLVEAEPGDLVLIHAGSAISRVE